MLATLAIALLASVLDTPNGFVPANTRDVFQARNGRGDSTPDWMVSSLNGRVRVETRVDWVKRDIAEGKAIIKKQQTPPKFTFKMDGMTVAWKPGQGVPVSDGWLDCYDGGEFGGGLIWYARDLSHYKLVSGRNTQIIAQTHKGLFAIQSLTHMMFWYSDLVELLPGPKGWSTKLVTNLHVSPIAVVQDGDRLVYMTYDFVTTLETDGKQFEIYNGDFERLEPESMVRLPSGVIWIGGSVGVLRLAPKADGGFSTQWFLKAPLRKKGR
jgi:hypothetical protein